MYICKIFTKKKYNRRNQFENIIGNVDKKELLEFKLENNQLNVLKSLERKLGKKKISYMTNDWLNYHGMDTHCNSHTDLWQVFVEDIPAGTERVLHCRDYSHVLVNFHFEKSILFLHVLKYILELQFREEN